MLTRQQIDDRMVIYDEVIEHLGGNICDTKSEEKQAQAVKNQIKLIQKRFYRKYCSTQG